jgi:hypothetical protein
MLFELLINPASDEAAKELEIVLTMSCSGAQQNYGIQSFWALLMLWGINFVAFHLVCVPRPMARLAEIRSERL